MNRQDIEELQSVHDYPAVSIFLTMQQKSTNDFQQTPIRLKNLAREMENRLLREHSQREIEPLLQKWEELVQTLDHRPSARGLAFFLSRRYGRVFSLPFAVEERVVVDENFATRELICALEHSKPYRLLVLSRESARLYEGVRDQLSAVAVGQFPLSRSLPGVESEWTGMMPPHAPHGGVDPDQLRTREDRNFLHRVDDALDEVMRNAPLPLAVMGAKKMMGLFNEVSSYCEQTIAQLVHDLENLPTHELEKRVWPVVQTALNASRERVLQRLPDAIGANKYSGGIQEVWSVAKAGQVDALLVEEDFRCPARLDETGFQIIPVADASPPGVMDDAVTEIVETVFATGGQVFFFDAGVLRDYDHIAAILRY